MKINTIIVHLSARFLKLYVESSSFWIGQRETVDCIRCYSQIYFAICMGHAWNWVHWNRCLKTFPSMCDSPHLRAGCTLKHGSGSLMDPMSTTVNLPAYMLAACGTACGGLVQPRFSRIRGMLLVLWPWSTPLAGFLNAWRPRGARSRVSVNFRKFTGYQCTSTGAMEYQ